MKNSSPRFETPSSSSRPRGARLLSAYSPKLGRTVRAYDHAGFEHWIHLEADPDVMTFCEHPRHIGSGIEGALIDFWVARQDREELLIVDRGQPAQKLPKSVGDLPLRLVPAVESAAAAVWISNWMRMIPVINATRGLAPKTLTRSVLNLIRQPLALSLVEHQLSSGDSPLVRGAIFELLRMGLLIAPSLHTEQLSLHTVLEPAQ